MKLLATVALAALPQVGPGAAPQSGPRYDERAGLPLVLRYGECLHAAAVRIRSEIKDPRLRYGRYATRCSAERAAYIDAFVRANDQGYWHQGTARFRLFRRASYEADQQVEAWLPEVDPVPAQF
jgi:hypothetical protein